MATSKYVQKYGNEWWVVYDYGMIKNRRGGPFKTRKEAEAELRRLKRIDG